MIKRRSTNTCLLASALLLSLSASAETEPGFSYPILQSGSSEASTKQDSAPAADTLHAAHEWFLQALQARGDGKLDEAMVLLRRSAEAGHVLAMHKLATSS